MSETSKGNSFHLLSSDDNEEQQDQQRANGNNEFEWDITGTELSQEKENRLREKRQRDDSGEYDEDEEFIKVRRRNKKLARSNSKNSNHNNSNTNPMNNNLYAFEVCLTSTQVLPKQIALAKLLNAESITKVLRIKYKGPYKVLVKFEKQEDADKLINCKKIKELGYKCQMTSEMSISYGIVKHIDIDLKEEEMCEIFQCQNKISSVKRLKRLTGDGQWVDSETIRLSFQSSTLPPYIHGYGCRFKVEPYTFPVTQCSGCWKYGHLVRYCPTKKIMCPKCGKDHANCETTKYTCINCKGDHMALNKSCPVFAKEKEIRKIMSSEGCSYRRAFEKYQEKELRYNNDVISECSDDRESTTTYTRPTYRDIVITEATIHKEESQKNSLSSTVNSGERKRRNKDKNVKEKIRKNQEEADPDDISRDSNVINQTEILSKKISTKNTEKNNEATIIRIFNKVKDIVFSKKDLREKIKQIVSVVTEEFTKWIAELIEKGNICNNLWSFVYG